MNKPPQIWVSTDDRGHKKRYSVTYDDKDTARITREHLTEFLTQAGFRLSMEVDE